MTEYFRVELKDAKAYEKHGWVLCDPPEAHEFQLGRFWTWMQRDEPVEDTTENGYPRV